MIQLYSGLQNPKLPLTLNSDIHFEKVYLWMAGWMDGCKSRFKDCLQQLKSVRQSAVDGL